MIKTIIENGIEVYKDYICHCKDKDDINCGLHIPYPKSVQQRRTYKCYGVSKYIRGHNCKGNTHPMKGRTGKNSPRFGIVMSQLQKDKISIANKKYRQEHPNEVKESIRHIINAKIGLPGPNLGKTFSRSKEVKENMSKIRKKYCKEHPEEMIKRCNNARKQIKFVSKPELKMRNYAIKLCKKYGIDYLMNVHEIVGTPDVVILNHKTGHHIALFQDGCHFHGCLKCYPILEEKSNENYEYHSFKRHYDKMINEDLIQQGFIVIRIWEHDVNNGNYKKILRGIKL